MADVKRYFWLKLPHDFFNSKRIKKLRKVAGGDTYTIIYLKMQLLSLKTDGMLTYTGLENTFAEELALDLDEDVENVQVTLRFLSDSGLIETSDNIEYFLPFVAENTGCETAAAQRMRDMRERQKELKCNNVTSVLQNRYGEIEIEKEKEIEKSKSKRYKDAPASHTRFIPPCEAEVRAYCEERGNHVDASRFCAFYESKGWMIGKNKMKDWRAAVRSWEKSDKKTTYTEAVANRMSAVEEYMREAGYDGT